MGVGHDVGIDRPIAQRDAQPDPQAIDAIERAGSARPGRDLRWVAQRDVVAPVRSGDHVLEESAIGHRPSQRPVVAVLIEVIRGKTGHAPERRLESDDPGERRGDADRAADVAAGGQWCVAGRQGRSGTSRRAARRELGVPRVARHAPEGAVAEAGATELGSRGSHMDDATGRLDAFDDRMVVFGDLVDERQRALLPRPPRHGLFFLGGDGQSLQRSRGITLAEVTLLGRTSLGAGLVVPTIDHRVHDRVVCFDLLDHALEVLHRRQLAVTEEVQRFVCSQVRQIGHRRSIAERLRRRC